MSFRSITYEYREHVGYVTLSRPESGNGLSREMADELADCCRRVNQDDQVRVVLLSGVGEVFSKGIAQIEKDEPSVASLACQSIASIKSPIVAALNGDALDSGLELALACDIRLAAEGARFGLTQTAYGAIPSGGGTQRLPRIVGRGKALEMVLSAQVVDASEAFRIGLVNRVLPGAKLVAEAVALGGKLASKGPIAERYSKEAINLGSDMTLAQGLGLEADLSFLLQSTRDRAEGISAFLEKRTPQFRGE